MGHTLIFIHFFIHFASEITALAVAITNLVDTALRRRKEHIRND